MTRFTRFAQTDEQEDSIRKVEGWLERLNKRIYGGTTFPTPIGQTVILDLTHQGSEIYINSDGNIEIFDVKVRTFEQFKEQYDKIDFRKIR